MNRANNFHLFHNFCTISHHLFHVFEPKILHLFYENDAASCNIHIGNDDGCFGELVDVVESVEVFA